MNVRTRSGDIAVSLVLLAVSAFFMWGAWRMPAGTFAVPGPGTMPMIASGLLALTAIALIVKALLDKTEAAAPVEMRWVPIITIFAALTATAVAFESAGFVVTLSVFLFIMLRVFSTLSTISSAITAIIITLAARWLFGTILGVQLPGW